MALVTLEPNSFGFNVYVSSRPTSPSTGHIFKTSFKLNPDLSFGKKSNWQDFISVSTIHECGFFELPFN